MNSKILIVIITFAATLFFNSCSIINTLVPKRSNHYINYNEMFADDGKDGKKATSNQDQIRMDGKVRIITINKITNDTIVEWVDPIELTGGKKTVFSTKKMKPETQLDTAFTIITKESEILAPHLAVVFIASDGGTSFQTRNDTMFVNTTNEKMQNTLLQLLHQNIESNVIMPIQNKNLENAKPTTRDKINGKLKAVAKRKKDKKIKQQKSNDELLVDNDDTEAEAIKKDTTLTVLPSTNVIINNPTVIGDMNFDMDASAELILNQDTLVQFLQMQEKKWTTFKCKAKIKLKTPTENKFFYANFRLKKNLNTWASINLPIIGELARVAVTSDSLRVLDKWKDKFYYYNATQMQSLINMPIPYSLIQSYIIGDVPLFNGTQIVGKKSKLGMAIKIIQPGLSCLLTFNADSNLATVLIIGNNNGKSYSIKHILSNYEPSTNGKFSTKRNIIVLENGKETSIQLDFNKYEFEQELDFPFTVPSHFANGNKEMTKQ